MALALVEPLRELFKDEVRALGRELGLPEAFVGRHPFPGPGLAVRILGEITQERLEILRQADAIFLGGDPRRRPVRCDLAGVRRAAADQDRGRDGRRSHLRGGLRAARDHLGRRHDRGFYPFDMAFLGRVANRIVNEVRGINRVVYDVTSKPPGTIEWE